MAKPVQTEMWESAQQVRDDFWSKLKEQGKDPLNCPCCGQTAKIYRRRINVGMARVLIRVHREDLENEIWVHVRDGIYTRGSSGDYGKLRFWDLLEPMDARTFEENASGHWRITEKGRQFVRGEITVPKYALVYDNAFYGHSGEHVGIKKCLGTKFDYEALMRGETG